MTKLIGLADLNRKFAKIAKLGRGDHLSALTAGGFIIRNGASRRAPVLSGTLRRSYTVEPVPGREAVAVGTNVEYAPYQEFGTRHQAGTPHLRPAVDEDGPQAAQAVKRAYEDLIRRKAN